MRRILILLESQEFALALRDALGHRYHVTLCDGSNALRMLQELRPDAFVLDLELPGTDGLLLLEDAEKLRPPVILGVTSLITPYLGQAAKVLNIGHILLKPFPIRTVTARIDDMLRKLEEPAVEDLQETIAFELRLLNFPTRPRGYLQLLVSIQLHMQDPEQSYKYELYPATAAICGADNGEQVERNIRTLLTKAWENRNESAWNTIFPGQIKCPTNTEFISRISEIVQSKITGYTKQ